MMSSFEEVRISRANLNDKSKQTEFVYSFKDPYIVAITLTAISGAFCFLAGLVLLCFVSKTLNSQDSEAILLIGIGFFIVTMCYITWKITSKRRMVLLQQMHDLNGLVQRI